VREVVASWRRLTGGRKRRDSERRTLIACSGGGDSSGLVLILAGGVTSPGEVFVVGHVVHDLRPEAEALVDREAAAELAGAAGIPFVQARIAVKRLGGNAEGTARRARYEALESLAHEQGCRFIATAHHAGDQLETVVMGLLRGSGPAGLAGVARRRRTATAEVQVIRPALNVGRDDLQRVCREAGWAWREDATNQDRKRLRSAVRMGVVPKLETLRPGAAKRAARSARLLADAAGVVNEQVDRVAAAGVTIEDAPGHTRWMRWERDALRKERVIVVGGVIRKAAARLGGTAGRDRLGLKVIEPAIRAIRGRGTDPKRFVLRGIAIEVDARRVVIGRLHA
jgi:tRNA(Ile)-lysidine synthase